MARMDITNRLDDNDLNAHQNNYKELYAGMTNAQAAKVILDNFLNGTGVVTSKMMAPNSVGPTQIVDGGIHARHIGPYAVGPGNLAADAVGAANIRPDSIGNRTLMKRGVFSENLALGSVGAEQLGNGAVTPDKTSTLLDDITVNKGKLSPLENYARSGVYPEVSDKIKNTILDAKIYGAKQGKAYSIDSIRYGFSGTYRIIVSEWNAPFNNALYSSSKVVVIDRVVTEKNEDASILEVFEGNNGNPDATTFVANQDGYTISVTFDNKAIGTIVNLSENDNGSGQGAIIHPKNYSYRVQNTTKNLSEETIFVEKEENKIRIFVKTDVGYTGYELIRKTRPFEIGIRGSNVDLWSINRISGYTRDGDVFTERDNRIFVYSPATDPTNTMDTIFRRVGDTDYSGGSYHGDEKIQAWKLFIGNYDATTVTGQFSGPTVEMVQETHLYPDSYTANAETTDAFMKVNKVHQFSYEKGYQLFTRTEALTDVELEMSNIGAFSARRVMLDGSANNFTDVLGLRTAKHIDVRTTSAGNQYMGQNETKYKFMGWYKQILIEIETDSDFLDTWVRNYSETDIKMYTRIIPTNALMEQGKIINSSVSYKFDVTG